MTLDREDIGALPNPLGLLGIEFIEYTTSRPQALGQLLPCFGQHHFACGTVKQPHAGLIFQLFHAVADC